MTTQELLTLSRPGTAYMCVWPDHEITGGGKAMLNISGLKEGIVLDHIEAGKSLDIYYHWP